MLLSEMTWAEAADAMEAAEVAIIPAGSHEQHGRHLALQQDTSLAVWLAQKAAEALSPNVVVSAPIAFGYSPTQMGFPGGINLKIKTLVDLSVDIHRGLYEHGVRKFVTLNAQSGEARPLYLASRAARDYVGGSTAYVDVWDFLPDNVDEVVSDGAIPGHGGEYQTSLAMHLFPDGVREDQIDVGEVENLDRRLPEHYRFLSRGLGEYSKTGLYSGNPDKATADKGKVLADAALEGFVAFLQKYIQYGDDLPLGPSE